MVQGSPILPTWTPTARGPSAVAYSIHSGLAVLESHYKCLGRISNQRAKDICVVWLQDEILNLSLLSSLINKYMSSEYLKMTK